MSDWKRSHWNKRDRIETEKPLTVPQSGVILFTNDERRIPLCVIWKEDGKDVFHTRGIIDEFNHSLASSSISKVVDYVESLLKQIQEEFKANESNS